MKRNWFVVGGAIWASVATVAWAEDAQPDRTWGDWDLTVGAGAAMVPEFDGAEDYTIAPIPILELDWRNTVFLSAERGLGWNAYKTRNFKIGPVGTYYLGSSDKPPGTNDVDPGFQIGAFAEFAFDHWKLDATVLQAVSGSSEGMRIGMGAAYGTRIEKDWRVILRLNTMFYNANEMKTYFGINAREASDSGLATYDPGMGFKDVGIDATVIYDVTKTWSIRGIGKLHYMLGEAADSPLVSEKGSDLQLSAGMGVAYHF